jgi:hypothetical protein
MLTYEIPTVPAAAATVAATASVRHGSSSYTPLHGQNINMLLHRVSINRGLVNLIMLR